jgi:hypothetical protein
MLCHLALHYLATGEILAAGGDYDDLKLYSRIVVEYDVLFGPYDLTL